MRLPHWIRYMLLVNKIKRRLPQYHPKTGEYLFWAIKPGRYRRISDYDTQTGKADMVFVPVPQIYNDTYTFLWPTKKIIQCKYRLGDEV